MRTKKQVIFNWSIPKKKKLFIALFWLDFKIIQLIFKPIIKKFFLIHIKNTDFIPWFRCLYWNIFAENAFLADWLFLDYAPIYIWSWTNIWFWCTLITSHHNPKDYNEIVCDPITIGKNCFIWTNSTILQGVKIWNNVIVWASSVVTKDIPNNTIVAWNPAKKIKSNYI